MSQNIQDEDSSNSRSFDGDEINGHHDINSMVIKEEVEKEVSQNIQDDDDEGIPDMEDFDDPDNVVK